MNRFAILLCLAAAPALAGGTNVKSGDHGCPAAAGSGTDDSPAITCQFNWMRDNGGGRLWFPCGNYGTSMTLQQYTATTVDAANEACAQITTSGDFTALNANPKPSGNGNEYEKIANISVVCSQSAFAANDCVVVGPNAVTHFDSVNIVGGRFALQNNGCDGTVFNSNLAGVGTTGGGLLTTSGNWYIRDKIDNGNPVAYGVYVAITPNSTCFENGFDETDFSGPYLNSIYINDVGPARSMTKIIGGVIGAPILSQNCRWLALSAVEITGSSIIANCPIGIGTSGPGPSTVSGTGTRKCDPSNIGVTC
jgi:hypothetical protein